MPGCSIELFTEGAMELPFGDISGEWITARAEECAGVMGLDNIILTIIVTDNEFIHTINRDYRKKNRPTDVISFAYRENPFPVAPGEPENLGDIYISLERAREQASEYDVSLKEEVKRLLVHGFLHLLGYDHEKGRKEKTRMEEKEAELMSRTGL